MVTFTVLGSGGGSASPGRASSGYLVETAGAAVLLDCGDGVTRSFLRAGKSFADVDAIIISHTHPDHVCGLSYFLQQMYLVKRRLDLRLLLPGEAIAGIKSWLTLNYLFVEHFPFAVQWEQIADGKPIVVADLRFVPRLNSHLTKHRGQPWMADYGNQGECFSWEIQAAGQRLVYTSDVGGLEDLRFVRGCDLLIVETTHLDPVDVFQFAERENVSRLMLTHLGPELDPDVAAMAGKHYSGEVITAKDGLQVTVPRP